MKYRTSPLPACLLGIAIFVGPVFTSEAEATPTPDDANPNNPALIDLPTALQLAGARSLDIQIARERLAEARANKESAVWQFFPWLAPGFSYRRHDNLIQDVSGNVID